MKEIILPIAIAACALAAQFALGAPPPDIKQIMSKPFTDIPGRGKRPSVCRRFLARERSDYSETEIAERYFAAFCFFLASARRSVFFRRLARFLALSLPRLCPIRLNLRALVAP